MASFTSAFHHVVWGLRQQQGSYMDTWRWKNCRLTSSYYKIKACISVMSQSLKWKCTGSKTDTRNNCCCDNMFFMLMSLVYTGITPAMFTYEVTNAISVHTGLDFEEATVGGLQNLFCGCLLSSKKDSQTGLCKMLVIAAWFIPWFTLFHSLFLFPTPKLCFCFVSLSSEGTGGDTQ